MIGSLPTYTLFPYTTLFRSVRQGACLGQADAAAARRVHRRFRNPLWPQGAHRQGQGRALQLLRPDGRGSRSEEHTSELQSPCNLVCSLLLENKTEELEIRET